MKTLFFANRSFFPNYYVGQHLDGCKEIKMERNEVYGVSTSNQAQGDIEMKKNVVYGLTAKPSDVEYEIPL